MKKFIKKYSTGLIILGVVLATIYFFGSTTKGKLLFAKAKNRMADMKEKKSLLDTVLEAQATNENTGIAGNFTSIEEATEIEGIPTTKG